MSRSPTLRLRSRRIPDHPMATTLRAEDARQSLTSHVEAKGIEALLKFGPQMGWTELQRLLDDRALVRYPCEIVFDATPLMPGEFAFPAQKGDRPEEGFTMFVHPAFALALDRVPALVLYHVVAVNYGEFASADEAETFGAAALGLTRDEYYAVLCGVSDQLGGVANGEPELESRGGGGSNHCSCGG